MYFYSNQSSSAENTDDSSSIRDWQEKLCTAVTKVSQTSQGVVDDVFPQQKIQQFCQKRSISFKMLIFGLKMKWDGVILPALISMKLA